MNVSMAKQQSHCLSNNVLDWIIDDEVRVNWLDFIYHSDMLLSKLAKVVLLL